VELHAGDVARERVQELIDDTFRNKITKDRRSEMPISLQVMAVVRMENIALWKKYAAQREKIRKARRCSGVQNSKWQEQTVPPSTAGSLHCLDEDVQESYLFHGTDANAALQIQHHGFCLDYARKGLFGAGIYCAEAASKADEYAGDDKEDFHVMLLSRVVRGVVHRVEQPDGDLHKKLNRRKYDSVLGDREAAVGTYREYVVYNEAQAYPEYAVIYRRIFPGSPNVPPLLLNSVGVHMMMAFRDSAGKLHKAVPVPEKFIKYLTTADSCTAKAIASSGNGTPDVLFADSTGDGEFDLQMMVDVKKDFDGVVRRTWVSIPSDLEFPLAALRGDLPTVQVLANGKPNLAEPVLHGMTALALARAQGHSEVIAFLQEAYRARRENRCLQHTYAEKTAAKDGAQKSSFTHTSMRTCKFSEQHLQQPQPCSMSDVEGLRLSPLEDICFFSMFTKKEKERLSPLPKPPQGILEGVNQQLRDEQEASRLHFQFEAEKAQIALAARLDAATNELLSLTSRPCPQLSQLSSRRLSHTSIDAPAPLAVKVVGILWISLQKARDQVPLAARLLT